MQNVFRNMIKISPSLLSADFADFRSAVVELEECGADLVHCDVMDGMYVPNITFGMNTISALKKYTKLPLDVHLMIMCPERYLEGFITAGANIISFHENSTKEAAKIIQIIRSNGLKAGLAINPDIDIGTLYPYLDELDVVIVMSVYAGFGGQKFIPEILYKIGELKRIIRESGLYTQVEIDGGVTLENAKSIRDAGVDIIVAGNCIFSSEDKRAAIDKLKS